jgi:hypothetical protein
MQKQNDCWWFGETGKCHNFYILMSFIGACTVCDFACLFLVLFSGDTASEGNTAGSAAESTPGEIWKYRFAVVAR